MADMNETEIRRVLVYLFNAVADIEDAGGYNPEWEQYWPDISQRFRNAVDWVRRDLALHDRHGTAPEYALFRDHFEFFTRYLKAIAAGQPLTLDPLPVRDSVTLPQESAVRNTDAALAAFKARYPAMAELPPLRASTAAPGPDLHKILAEQAFPLITTPAPPAYVVEDLKTHRHFQIVLTCLPVILQRDRARQRPMTDAEFVRETAVMAHELADVVLNLYQSDT